MSADGYPDEHVAVEDAIVGPVEEPPDDDQQAPERPMRSDMRALLDSANNNPWSAS